MINFRDKTFCKFYKECLVPCERALTEVVAKAAVTWWGGMEPPICIFLEKPDCFKEKKNV